MTLSFLIYSYQFENVENVDILFHLFLTEYMRSIINIYYNVSSTIILCGDFNCILYVSLFGAYILTRVNSISDNVTLINNFRPILLQGVSDAPQHVKPPVLLCLLVHKLTARFNWGMMSINIWVLLYMSIKNFNVYSIFY